MPWLRKRDVHPHRMSRFKLIVIFYSVTAEIEGEDRTLIAGAKFGIAKLDPETGKLEYISELWQTSDGEGKAER